MSAQNADSVPWRIVPMQGVSPAVERKVVTTDGRVLGRLYRDRRWWVAVIGGYTAVATSMNLAVIRARGNAAEAAQNDGSVR